MYKFETLEEKFAKLSTQADTILEEMDKNSSKVLTAEELNKAAEEAEKAQDKETKSRTPDENTIHSNENIDEATEEVQESTEVIQESIQEEVKAVRTPQQILFGLK